MVLWFENVKPCKFCTLILSSRHELCHLLRYMLYFQYSSPIYLYTICTSSSAFFLCEIPDMYHFVWYISHFHCAYHFPSNVFYVTFTSNVPDISIFPISICIYTILNITASDGYGGHTSVSNVSTTSAILGIYPSATLVSLS